MLRAREHERSESEIDQSTQWGTPNTLQAVNEPARPFSLTTQMPRHGRLARFMNRLSRLFTWGNALSVQNLHHTNVNSGIYVNGEGNVVVRGDVRIEGNQAEVTSRFMSIFAQRIISGISYRDSSRVPRCHPDTRVNTINRIKSWLDGQGPEELLLWISGAAGVGKSAIVQTLAEHLDENGSLGASLFFSRPGGHNDPQLVFTTIAYHLAIRIKAYRDFIIERLSFDQDFLNARMEQQFTTLIVEPFKEKVFEEGGKRWGILLDGFDELEGKGAQRKIIELISTFTRKHHNVPLVWIISSRLDPHIVNRFSDDDIRQGCWTESIPIDSTESCEDVKRFVRASFRETQEEFPHALSALWPGEEAVTKIAAAASGLFIYAEVLMHTIRDPQGGNPDEQLSTLLSGIDQSTKSPDPFVRLDQFYSKILFVQSWPRKKKLLHFVLQWKHLSAFTPKSFNTLRGMSILFGLTRAAIYGCLEECHSTLRIPEWHVAHQESLGFLHESFSEYLTDLSRSQDFHINTEDAKGDALEVALRIFELWDECSRCDIVTVSVESAWREYCLKRDWTETKTPAITEFHAELYRELVHCLNQLVIDNMMELGEPLIEKHLRKFNFIKLCYYLNSADFWDFALGLLRYSDNLNMKGLVRRVSLRSLTFSHFDWKDTSPAHAHAEGDGNTISYILHRPLSSDDLRQFVSELEFIQAHLPEAHAFICGIVPEGRVTVFRCPLQPAAWLNEHFLYYILPYPK